MSLILKQEAANAIPAPPLGKGTLFLNSTDQLVVKDSAGNISSALTLTSTGNTSVLYNNAGAVGLPNNMTFNNTTNTFAVTNANIGNLTVTGTLTAGNIAVSSIANGNSNVNIATANGNVTVSAAGNTTLTVTGTGVNVAGTLNTGSGNINTTGNVSGAFFIGNGSQLTGISGGGGASIANGNSNVNIATANGNVTITAVGNTTMTVTGSGVIVSGNANVGNLTTAQVLASANITTPQFISNVTTGTAPIVVTSTTQVANLNVATAGLATFATTANAVAGANVSGTVANATFATSAGSANSVAGANVSGQVANALVAGTVYTNAQPNITSVGTLTSLDVSGTITAANITANTGVFTGNGNGLSSLVGANVTGNVGNALNAYAVAGANVTGTVANATFATSAGSADSVAVANVSGIGNIATVNLDGNLSNILYGNGVFASAPAGGSYGNSNVATFLASYGSNTISTTGNITAGNIIGNGQALTGIAGANVSGQVANALIAGTVYTNAQPNITSVGTLTGLTVSGNILPSANVTYDLGSPTQKFKDLYLSGNSIILGAQTLSANASGVDLTGTLSGDAGGLSNIIGANVSGQVGNALVASTVYTNAQPNITSVGTLSSLSVTGNISGGNLTTSGLVSATGNITSSANVVTDLIVGRTQSVSITATGTNQNINLTPTGTGTVNVGNFIISNVAIPLASTDAATKQYVDDVAQGLHTHDSCNAATQTTLASISNGTVTYNNGTSGVGATLTTTGAYTTIDGVTLSNGMRILVKDEVTTANNGIYVRTSATVLTRADDFDTPTEMAGGDFTFVTAGTLYDNTGWVMIDVVTTVGTSPVVWVQFSGAGTYTAGTGLTLTGSQFSITNTTVTAGAYGNGDYNATFTVNSQGQLTAAANVAITANAANLTGTLLNSSIVTSSLTSVGTLTSLGVTGNISAGNVNAGNLLTANYSTAVITTAAQPNITSVGTLTSLAVTGNISAGNVSATNFTGLASSATVASSANAVAGANVSGQVANALVAGTVYTNAQPNITSVGTLTSLAVTGNTTSGNFIGIFANGNSSISIPAANGNIIISATGAVNEIVITSTGVNVAGTLNATGNVTAAYYSGNGSPLTGVVATIRTVTVADATSVTMNTDTSDIVVQTNTQVAGTLTINAVTGTPINGQKIILRLQSANVQTFSWNAVFAGSTDTPLPTASSGSNKYDYLGFIYNSIATKWQMMAKNFGF